MKQFQIALFLFNIFAISAVPLVPKNMEIVFTRSDLTDGIDGKDNMGKKPYEQRFDYLKESDKVEYDDLNFNYLDQTEKKLTAEAEKVIKKANKEGHQEGSAVLKAHDPTFIVSFINLKKEQVDQLLKLDFQPMRIEGKVEIGKNFDELLKELDAELAALRDRAAAAAAEPPPTERPHPLTDESAILPTFTGQHKLQRRPGSASGKETLPSTLDKETKEQRTERQWARFAAENDAKEKQRRIDAQESEETPKERADRQKREKAAKVKERRERLKKS